MKYVNLKFKALINHAICRKADQNRDRGSYISAHVLLNLLNELGKRDKMRGLPSILSLFRNRFNKFSNTRARMLDSIYHMTSTLKPDYWRKNVIILSLCTQRCYGRHNVKPLVVYRFYCIALFHSKTRRHMIMQIKKLMYICKVENGKRWRAAILFMLCMSYRPN